MSDPGANQGVSPGPYGYEQPNSASDDFNAHSFLIEQAINRVATTTLVMVRAVNPPAPGGAVGTLDVQPMVNQLDGAGQATPHGIVHNLPYFRLQGGANAVIMDPSVGDIGIALFASHDISSVKNTRRVANPGSRRRYSYADGLYVGGILNGQPTQVVQFGENGISITSPAAVTITAPSIVLHGNISTSGTVTNNGRDIGSTHRHSGVQAGGGISGIPA